MKAKNTLVEPHSGALIKSLVLLALVGAGQKATAGNITFSMTDSACTTGCVYSPAGTVTLSQTVAGTVHVSILLDPNYGFRLAADPNHKAFGFDLSSALSGVTIANVVGGKGTPNDVTQTFTYSSAGFNTNTFGSFGSFLVCTTCTKGNPGQSGATTTLNFDVLATNITTTSFVSNSLGHFFVSDVVQTTGTLAGSTGNFADHPATVPEPETVTMMGAGILLVGIAAIRRRTCHA